MRKIILIALLLSLPLFCFGQDAATQATPRYKETQPLQLTIKSDKEEYKRGEEMKLEATIKNNSDKEMIVFWNNIKPSLRIEESVSATVILTTFPVKDAETIYVKSGDAITKYISIENTLEPRGSKYFLRFQYDCSSMPVDFRHGPNQRVFTGTLISNAIFIEAVETKDKVGKCWEKAKSIKVGMTLVEVGKIGVLDGGLQSSRYKRYFIPDCYCENGKPVKINLELSKDVEFSKYVEPRDPEVTFVDPEVITVIKVSEPFCAYLDTD